MDTTEAIRPLKDWSGDEFLSLKSDLSDWIDSLEADKSNLIDLAKYNKEPDQDPSQLITQGQKVLDQLNSARNAVSSFIDDSLWFYGTFIDDRDADMGDDDEPR
jgi:hypothetical protein